MVTNLPSCFFIQFLGQLLKFLVNFTLLEYVKSQRSCGFLITKELTIGFQILDLKDHFSASSRHFTSSRGRSRPGEATPRSAHESFDARSGNHTKLSTSIFVRSEGTLSELTFREEPITAQWVRSSNPQVSNQ